MGVPESRILGRAGVILPPPALGADDQRWQLVLRIIKSRQFSRSKQLRDTLLYISQRSLSASEVTIKEHEIGCEALGRGPGFDPHNDNIVRVQMGLLRKRLDEYFGAEGKDEPLRVVVPKGSYVPYFEPAPSAEALPIPDPPPSPLPAEDPRRTPAALWICVAVLLAAAGFVAGRAIPTTPKRTTAPASAADTVWSGIFGGAQPATVVAADTCLVMLQDILDTDIELKDYVSPQYPQNVLSHAKSEPLRAALELIARRSYTSLGDLNTISALVRTSQRYSKMPAQIRYARHLNIREFKTGSFILVGSRRGVPWVDLFEPSLNFAVEEDGNTGVYFFRNRNPRAGELATYRQSAESGKAGQSYANLAVVPNLGKTGYVMLLSGLTMEATEAAGEMVTGPEFERVLTTLQKSAGASSPRYFEVLMRTRVIAGAAKDADVVAWRILQPE